MNNLFEIIEDPNPILRQPTQEVENFDFETQQTIDRMVATMRANKGVGLAAPQVGLSKKIIVLEFSGEDKENHDYFPLTVLVNPKIEHYHKEKSNLVEGCLSFPSFLAHVLRPSGVMVSGLDRWGKKIKIDANGFYARVIQHEIDHLDGILFTDRLEKLKTVLFSNMALGLPILDEMRTNPIFDFKGVVVGTKNEVSHSSINMFNESRNVGKRTIVWNNSQSIIEQLKPLKLDLIIVAGFGKILPDEIINLPKFGSLNIHPSLLPKYRGASPVVATILSGDKTTGVTIIKMTAAMDAGPIVGQMKVKLTGTETNQILLPALAKFGAELLADIVPYYISGEIKPVPQQEEKATYTKIISKNDGQIKSKDSAVKIDRMIRAYNPWPSVWTFSGNKKIQLTSGHLNPENKLVIDTVKPEGKKEISLSDFRNGYKLPLKYLDGKTADS